MVKLNGTLIFPKRQLWILVCKKKTAAEMTRILFDYRSVDVKVFFKKVLRNIVDFWKGMDMA